METQRILVNGGAGFIGTNLVNELQIWGQKAVAQDLLNSVEGRIRHMAEWMKQHYWIEG